MINLLPRGSLEISLIVEVDGRQHQESEHDAVRDNYLRERGFRILRFWSNRVLSETEGVLQLIFEETGRSLGIGNPHPNQPS